MVDQNENVKGVDVTHKEEVDIPRHMMTRLGIGLERAYKSTGAINMADFCSAAGISVYWMYNNFRRETEPMWMRNLRAIKRTSGLSWEDILGR